MREMRLLTVASMRELDRRAIEEYGLAARGLMELAGGALARAAAALRQEVGASGPVLVLAGGGNNGGDGLACARHLAAQGIATEVILLAGRSRLSPESVANLALLPVSGVMCLETEGAVPPDLATRLGQAAVVVDCLLGIGVRGALRPPLPAVIERINACGRPVLAADVPSGHSGDLDPPAGPVVAADRTVCMGAVKVGLFAPPGRTFAGEIEVEPLGIPREAWRDLEGLDGIEAADARALVPIRRSDGHKGTYGTVLCVAGSNGLVGAAALASVAALRVGAGLCTLACPEAIRPILAGKLTEVTVRGVSGTPDGMWASEAAAELRALGAGVDVVVVGPGLGRGPGVRPIAEAVLALDHPKVVDADGLNALDLATIRSARGPVVITPHPGEAARLLGSTTARVQGDRVAAVRAMAREGNCTAVLKGAGTLIGRPDGQVAVNRTGNDGMATGGTGDVLAGMIGGLLAQGADPWAAALAATYLHGLAGDRAARKIGRRALLARDLSRSIAGAFRELLGPEA